MTSVCCFFDQGLFHFLLRWWLSLPGGVLPLIHRLSCVGVASFYALPLYPTMFYRADASSFLFVSYNHVLLGWCMAAPVECVVGRSDATIHRAAPRTKT
jgi:hypothetical protein